LSGTATAQISLLSLHDALPILAELGMVSEAEAAAAREEVPAIAELEAYGSYPYPSFVNHVIDELLGHFTRFYLQEGEDEAQAGQDRKSTRLNSSHVKISYAVFC